MQTLPLRVVAIPVISLALNHSGYVEVHPGRLYMKNVIITSNHSATGSRQTSGTILTFGLDEQTYGLPITAVSQIIELVAITRIPQVPPGVQGVINVHGKIVPVIDLRQRFNLLPAPYHLHTPLILTHVENHTLALVVDEVKEVVDLGQNSLPDMETAELIAGTVNVDRQLIPMVNVRLILSQEEQKQLCQILASTPFLLQGKPEKLNGHRGDPAS